MILMRTKYLKNSLRDSSLSQYSIAKILFIPGGLHYSKMPFEQLFLDEPIFQFNDLPITSARISNTDLALQRPQHGPTPAPNDIFKQKTMQNGLCRGTHLFHSMPFELIFALNNFPWVTRVPRVSQIEMAHLGLMKAATWAPL